MTGMTATTQDFLEKPLSVSEVNRKIKMLLEEKFPWLRVRGEISGLRRPSSGHAYFTLKEAGSQMRAVLWRNTLRRLTTIPKEGQAVIATGRIALYEPRGEYQLVVEGLASDGIGSERERLLALYTQLADEGLFDAARKRDLPLLPQVIGLATSASGAILHDVIQVLDQRFPGYHLLLAPCRVQGTGSDQEIADALDLLNRDARADIILCGRGGGSAEDLAAFNSELVVRAIARSGIPVVSAVGHEMDQTLADLAADLRTPTPSAAAERMMPERAVLQEQIHTLRHRSHRAILEKMRRWREQTHYWSARMVHPKRQVETMRLRCDDNEERLIHSIKRLHALYQERLCHQKDHLTALSPQAVLDRGFAIVRDAKGNIVRRATDTHPGDRISILLSDGALKARVSD